MEVLEIILKEIVDFGSPGLYHPLMLCAIYKTDRNDKNFNNA